MNKTNLFITDSDFANTDKSFEYLLGFQPSLGAMLLDDNNLDVILDSRYFAKTKNIDEVKIKNILGKEDIEIKFHEGNFNKTKELLKEKPNIILQPNIAVKFREELIKLEKNIQISDKLYFKEKRIIKTPEEKEKLKKAIEIIDKVFFHIEELNDNGELSGKTELQIRGILISKIFEYGGTGESFDSIVAFGKNSAIPHHNSGNTIIGNGPLLIDMGALYNGYCSDFTRTFWVGEKSGDSYEKFIKIYEIVKNAHNNAFKKSVENMIGGQIDYLTRKEIEDKGYEKYYTHGTGHGVGLDIHESPSINEKSEEKIKNGMVFTIEPGIYLEGKFGVRLEDIVFMEESKLKKYTKVKL